MISKQVFWFFSSHIYHVPDILIVHFWRGHNISFEMLREKKGKNITHTKKKHNMCEK